MGWYYRVGEQEFGPVNKQELQRLINTRKINASTLVRHDNARQWRPLAELVKGSKHRSAAPPPPPPDGTEGEPSVKPPEIPPPPTTGDQVPAGDDVSPAAAVANMPFQFIGSGSEYFKIWIVNIVLSVLTLGIYSAWAKVRRKQYFYGNTRIHGASFQYLADPVKILKGRIIVFVGFVAYSLVNQLYPMFAIVIILAFLPALPWFVVRSLSFNARNSAMRNIRFNFVGTYFEAAKVFLFWPMLMPFTLGLIVPYLLYRQKKFLVENSAYGITRFFFQATARDYYALVLRLLIPFGICILAGVGAGMLFPPAAALVFVIFYLYAMAYFAVKSSNLLYNSSRLSANGFLATMAMKEYLIIVVTNTLATVLTLGFFHPFAQVRAYRYKISQLALLPGGSLDQFVAAEQEQVSALGDEMSDFMDFDLGL